MLSRRSMLTATAGAAICMMLETSPLSAGGDKFTQAAFEAAQKAGKPIVVEIAASWCPVCWVQKPIVEDVVMSDRFKDMVHFEVDFDTQKDVMRRLNASKQSMLIVFKGGAEVGRSIGDTKRESIEALMAKAL